jgi:hypothetical protein
VVFVVVADVEGDQVEGTVIGVGLEALFKHIVLGDEMAGNWVEAHGQKGPAEEVEQHFSAWIKRAGLWLYFKIPGKPC